MSEQLENTVREMLKEETWTRTGITNFTKTNLTELETILNEARSQNCENEIKNICDEQLSHSKDSTVALYLSGMIAIRQGSIDTSSIVLLTEIFEKNHKEALIEEICNFILAEDPQNKFALRKIAEFYKNSNDDRVWDYYEQIVKVDFNEADIAKVLAERYESQSNVNAAISYYKKALARYVSTKNVAFIKETWSKLVSLIPEEIDYFLQIQRKIAKTISADKSAVLMQDVYNYYKDTNKWDTAIDIIKLILEIDNKDSWARKEIVECFRGKYAGNAHLEDYIRSSNLNQSFRNVFEAINDFEKHIAFDARNYVAHRTWGIGIITKVEGDVLTINFGKKSGIHTMSLKMAVTALTPLAKDHIWVKKATKKREELAKEVKADIAGTLKTIIKSFDNNCDEKRIKAELVPSILTQGEWTNWHNKAQKILENDKNFAVNPSNINFYTVRDREITRQERLANEFKAEKDFFKKIDVMNRYMDEIDDPSDEQFTDMFTYFASYLKSFSNVNEYIVASYLVIQDVTKKFTNFTSPANFTFAQLYGDIDNPREMYTELKNAGIRESFLTNIKLLQNWDDEYIKLLPTIVDVNLSKTLVASNLIKTLIASGKKEKVIRYVQTAFNEYRNHRNAVIYLFNKCENEDWYKESGIAEEKQIITVVNIISLCYKEVRNHVNTVENKKTIKNATTLLFAKKDENGNIKNIALDYMLKNDESVINRIYTMINDVRDLDANFTTQLRNGILDKYPEFKFQEAETKAEEPKGLLVTAKMLDVKRALAEDLEKVQLPKISEEVAEAKAKGDLKENAEYQSAKEAQSRMNSQLARLNEELARAVIFDFTTATTSLVSFGTTVTLQNNLTGSEEKYTILGPWESNVDEGIISYLSPLGNSLLNLKPGENKKFVINEHNYDYTVKNIVVTKK